MLGRLTQCWKKRKKQTASSALKIYFLWINCIPSIWNLLWPYFQLKECVLQPRLGCCDIPGIFWYFLPLLQTGQRGDHGKMCLADHSGLFLTHCKLSSASSDIQIFKKNLTTCSLSCTTQTTKRFSHTSPAAANSISCVGWVAAAASRVPLNREKGQGEQKKEKKETSCWSA